jgi:transposase
MNITTIGIDLAKNVLQVHGCDARGKAVLRRQFKRDQIVRFFAQLNPFLIGMEACFGAHHWARRLTGLGHTVRLMAPQFVKPYVKSNKNDVADAEAICEALGRPSMRFVPVKNIEQQSLLCLHRARQGSQSLKLEKIPGIGPLTATALVASVGDGKCFKNGRQFAAWLGLVPQQYSSGGKPTLLGISKRGDSYLRTLLIHGARTLVRHLKDKTDPTATWVMKLLQRRHANVATVALANKNARIVWALLVHNREFEASYRPSAVTV